MSAVTRTIVVVLVAMLAGMAVVRSLGNHQPREHAARPTATGMLGLDGTSPAPAVAIAPGADRELAAGLAPHQDASHRTDVAAQPPARLLPQLELDELLKPVPPRSPPKR